MTEDEIRDLIRKGDEAARRAMVPRMAPLGELLLEARCQLTHREFYAWIKRNFKMKASFADYAMDCAYAARREKTKEGRCDGQP